MAFRGRGRYRTLLMLLPMCVGLTIGPMAMASAASLGDQPRIVKYERLGPNFDRIEWLNGAKYVGSPIEIDEFTFETWERPDGQSGGGVIGIMPEPSVEIRSQADIQRAAAAYKSSGRSPTNGRAALSLPPAD
ncbi:MAG TPA: hypothetical protein VFS96_03475 [Nitrolancea sp.]|nr:hypothetical protein [Nitrolancea sp.]